MLLLKLLKIQVIILGFKLTEIYCNNSVPPSIGYMSFSVNNNIMTRTYEKNGVIEESNTYNIFTGNLNTNCFDLSSTTGTTTTTTGTTTWQQEGT